MRWSVLIVALAAACAVLACVKSGETECGSQLCPVGLACVSDHCVDSNIVASCNGLANNAGCSIGAGGSGVCQGGICIVGRCGDGIINGVEACDGPALGGSDCTDFGSPTPAGLKCAPDCSFDSTGCSQSCGNGHVEGNEQCDGSDLDQKTCTDYGFYGGTLSCSTSSCLANLANCMGKCGDGILQANVEECDGIQGTGSGTPAKTCDDLGHPGPGTLPLICTATCTYDPSSCTCGGVLCPTGQQCTLNGVIAQCN